MQALTPALFLSGLASVRRDGEPGGKIATGGKEDADYIRSNARDWLITWIQHLLINLSRTY
jgi:hypothetical protein